MSEISGIRRNIIDLRGKSQPVITTFERIAFAILSSIGVITGWDFLGNDLFVGYECHISGDERPSLLPEAILEMPVRMQIEEGRD